VVHASILIDEVVVAPLTPLDGDHCLPAKVADHRPDRAGIQAEALRYFWGRATGVAEDI
jgi:hypothetical protein